MGAINKECLGEASQIVRRIRIKCNGSLEARTGPREERARVSSHREGARHPHLQRLLHQRDVLHRVVRSEEEVASVPAWVVSARASVGETGDVQVRNEDGGRRLSANAGRERGAACDRSS